MKRSMLFGIILVVLGALALTYEGITYVTQEEIIDAGPIELSVDNKETIPLSPIFGTIALVGGIGLIGYSSSKS